MKTAVCQFTATNDGAQNLRTCIELVVEAAEAGAHLAVLPEASMYFDPTSESAAGSHGESIDGPFVRAIAQAAQSAKITVVVGMTESLIDDARDSNTLVALSPQGDLLGVYRKLHLYDAFGYRESEQIRPGEVEQQPLVFEVGGMRVGALTCYDLRFPEAFRWVVDAGAEVIALPAAWAPGPLKEDHWTTLLKARAIENTVYVAAAGQTGPTSCGQSAIVDPMGVVLCSAGERLGSAFASLTSERIASVRKINPSLGNRRFGTVPFKSR